MGMFMTRFGAAAALAILASGAEAHHSAAMFDPARTVTLTGTVREFQFTNPHAYIQLVVRDESGQQVEWSIEMGAPTHLRGRGWKKTTLKAGDRVTVTIAPLRNGRNGGELRSVTTPDGKPLVTLS